MKTIKELKEWFKNMKFEAYINEKTASSINESLKNEFGKFDRDKLAKHLKRNKNKLIKYDAIQLYRFCGKYLERQKGK